MPRRSQPYNDWGSPVGTLLRSRHGSHPCRHVLDILLVPSILPALETLAQRCSRVAIPRSLLIIFKIPKNRLRLRWTTTKSSQGLPSKRRSPSSSPRKELSP